jgi:hypothetical protein
MFLKRHISTFANIRPLVFFANIHHYQASINAIHILFTGIKLQEIHGIQEWFTQMSLHLQTDYCGSTELAILEHMAIDTTFSHSTHLASAHVPQFYLQNRDISNLLYAFQ